jgi:protein-S-isoprenylcysteine O-methyltransferase Ste14
MLERTLPVVGSLSFLAIGVGWRAWLHWRRYGTTGVALFRSRRLGQDIRDGLFSSMFAILAGYTLLLPTVPSVFMLASTIVAIRGQVLQEEKYLRRTYGDSYARYASRVGRFIPGIGRLAYV